MIASRFKQLSSNGCPINESTFSDFDSLIQCISWICANILEVEIEEAYPAVNHPLWKEAAEKHLINKGAHHALGFSRVRLFRYFFNTCKLLKKGELRLLDFYEFCCIQGSGSAAGAASVARRQVAVTADRGAASRRNMLSSTLTNRLTKYFQSANEYLTIKRRISENINLYWDEKQPLELALRERVEQYQALHLKWQQLESAKADNAESRTALEVEVSRLRKHTSQLTDRVKQRNAELQVLEDHRGSQLKALQEKQAELDKVKSDIEKKKRRIVDDPEAIVREVQRVNSEMEKLRTHCEGLKKRQKNLESNLRCANSIKKTLSNLKSHGQQLLLALEKQKALKRLNRESSETLKRCRTTLIEREKVLQDAQIAKQKLLNELSSKLQESSSRLKRMEDRMAEVLKEDKVKREAFKDVEIEIADLGEKTLRIECQRKELSLKLNEARAHLQKMTHRSSHLQSIFLDYVNSLGHRHRETERNLIAYLTELMEDFKKLNETTTTIDPNKENRM